MVLFFEEIPNAERGLFVDFILHAAFWILEHSHAFFAVEWVDGFFDSSLGFAGSASFEAFLNAWFSHSDAHGVLLSFV